MFYLFALLAPACSALHHRDAKSPPIVNQPSIIVSHRQELESYDDLQYYATIELGGQSLKALVDTNSLELVVLSVKCNYWCGKAKNLFNGTSEFYTKADLGVELSFNDGTLFGHEAFDQLHIGPYTIRQQPFWEITDADMIELLQTPIEAIFGLGPVPSDAHSLTPRDWMDPTGFALSLQSADFNRYSLCIDSRPGHPGYLNWNDETLVKKPELFQDLIVIPHQFWMAPLTDVYLGDTLLGCSIGCVAVFDSTAPLLTMPNKYYSAYRNKILEMKPSCNSLGNLPYLTFKLGNVSHQIPAEGYLGDFSGSLPASMNPYVDFGEQLENGSSCQASILNVEVNSTHGPVWILGAPFFRNYYTVFQQHPRGVYTAKFEDNCKLESERSLNRNRVRKARAIDVSKLSMPRWLRLEVVNGSLSQEPTYRKVSKLPHGH